MSYFPYGEERTSTADGREKFGTYFRDPGGVDYADQRYYASAGGQFMTPDPDGLRGANPLNSTSWNRYAYVNGDPANFTDRCGIAHQSLTQTFSATLDSKVSVGLAIAAFGGTVANPVVGNSIEKYPGYISINGNTGGQVQNGRLVPGTYKPCN
jgi:RHS repeat-associated protein